MPIRSLIIILLVSPAGVWICHAVSYRALGAAGKRPTAHTSAMVAIAAGFGILLALLWRLAWPAVAHDRLSLVCGLAYVCAVYGALAVLYLDAVNIAETSLHMHVLLEIAWGERPSVARLNERYGPDRVVAERLDRLTALGQVRRVDGRYHVADRSALRVAKVIDLWRIVLGLPTSPDRPLQAHQG